MKTQDDVSKQFVDLDPVDEDAYLKGIERIIEPSLAAFQKAFSAYTTHHNLSQEEFFHFAGDKLCLVVVFDESRGFLKVLSSHRSLTLRYSMSLFGFLLIESQKLQGVFSTVTDTFSRAWECAKILIRLRELESLGLIVFTQTSFERLMHVVIEMQARNIHLICLSDV